MVAGYAIGGGHVLHLVCDLTIAAENARFGQVGPKVGSFDGGFGAGLLANLVGPKKAKEIWFLCEAILGRGGAADGASSTRSCRSSVWRLRRCSPVRGDARALAVRAAPAEGELQRAPRTASQASSSSRTTPPAVRRQRGGSGGPRRLQRAAQPDFSALPPASLMSVAIPERPSAVRIWLMAARLRTLPAAVAPVLAAPRSHSAPGTSGRSRSSQRCWSRSSSRSGQTCPTTTPMRGAAPIRRTGSDR